MIVHQWWLTVTIIQFFQIGSILHSYHGQLGHCQQPHSCTSRRCLAESAQEHTFIPMKPLHVCPHQAAEDVSNVGNPLEARRGVVVGMDGATPPMDRKVVGVVLFGVVAVVTGCTPAGCKVVQCSCSNWCSVVVVPVCCSWSWSWSCSLVVVSCSIVVLVGLVVVVFVFF